MAKFNDGILGGFTGRVGNVIGYRRNGKWVMRALPKKVKNPRTDKQTEHREIFKLMIQTAAMLHEGIHIGMRDAARVEGITARNLFVKINKQCFSLVDGALETDYDSLLVSYGPLPEPLFGHPEVSAGGVVAVNFTPSADDRPAIGSDYVYLFAVCPDKAETALSLPVLRASGTAGMTLPAQWDSHAVHLYGFAANHDGQASPSVHLAL